METGHIIQTERCQSGVLYCANKRMGKLGQGYCQSKIN